MLGQGEKQDRGGIMVGMTEHGNTGNGSETDGRIGFEVLFA